MSKKTIKFDALAYAISVLGRPSEISRNRFAEEDHGFISDCYSWRLPCGRWLFVDEWDDGDQSTAGVAWGTMGSVAVRDNDDGSPCPEYEEQARGLIDAYAEAVAVK